MQMTQNSGLEPLNFFFTMLINEGHGPLRPRYRPVASKTLSVLNFSLLFTFSFARGHSRSGGDKVSGLHSPDLI